MTAFTQKTEPNIFVSPILWFHVLIKQHETHTPHMSESWERWPNRLKGGREDELFWWISIFCSFPHMCNAVRVLMIASWRSGPQMMAVYSQHSAATQLRSVTWLSTTRTHCWPQQAVTKPSECGVYAPVPPSLFCRPMRPPSHPSW